MGCRKYFYFFFSTLTVENDIQDRYVRYYSIYGIGCLQNTEVLHAIFITYMPRESNHEDSAPHHELYNTLAGGYVIIIISFLFDHAIEI